MDKFKSYTRAQVEFALLDCHQALIAGEYSPDHPYGRKLWAEIDALRDRSAVLLRRRRDDALAAHDKAQIELDKANLLYIRIFRLKFDRAAAILRGESQPIAAERIKKLEA